MSIPILVDQGYESFRGAARNLMRERVAHVPGLGRPNLISTKQLAAAFDAPVKTNPVKTYPNTFYDSTSSNLRFVQQNFEPFYDTTTQKRKMMKAKQREIFLLIILYILNRLDQKRETEEVTERGGIGL